MQIVAFSPDGRTLASGSDDNTVRLWDVDTGAHLKTLVGHSSYIISVAFSPDGSVVASGSEDDNVRLWDVATGKRLRTLRGHRTGVESLAFTSDGKILASGSRDSTVRLWDLDTGETLHILGGHYLHVLTVAFSPDDKILASAGIDSIIRLWDVDTGEEMLTIDRETLGIESVAFSPDGKILATGAWNDEVSLWDANTGEELKTLIGHASSVESVVFSSDGTMLASGSWDGTVLLWDATLPPAPEEPPPPPVVEEPKTPVEDVNGNGVVNIFDLALVGLQLGQMGENDADVNGDGVVDITDLVQVAGAIGDTTAAPAGHPLALTNLTPADVEGWLTQAQGLDLTDIRTQKGILFLEQLLASLVPQETALLANYPNPFNPETWIPYQLARDADVTLTVYDMKGTPVRQFNLGYQPAGYYTGRTKAAYWDGRNEIGESVASGVYFYQLQAGDYTDLRRMVILK